MLATPTALPVGPDGRPRVSPPITQLSGPYRLETGWWHAERARDYFYGEREDGAVLWLYRERGRGTWFVHGWVE